MKTANRASLTGISFCQRNGRARFDFRLDATPFHVNARFHRPPSLASSIWEACLQDLALSCLVDVSTAGMARCVTIDHFDPGRYGIRMIRSAAEALRTELVNDNRQSVGRIPLRIETHGTPQCVNAGKEASGSRVLVLMGGGKDSLYTYHLLRKANYDVQCFYLTEARRTWQQLRRVYRALQGKILQHRAFLNVNRLGELDREFNQAYRSQFQIGQVIAASVPYAIANHCKYIALGLERSSDVPMRSYRGRSVNHQHQKSKKFIQLLNQYLRWRYQGALHVISPIYGMYDLGIYQRLLYSASPLVRLQSSCGGANHYAKHCGKCEKCAFVALLLAGLSGNRRLYHALFPVDPLENIKLFDTWLSEGSERPLTCAGLKEEAQVALCLLKARNWQCALLHRVPEFLPGNLIEECRSLLAVHKNPLAPASMQRRIKRLLSVPNEQILALLRAMRPESVNEDISKG